MKPFQILSVTAMLVMLAGVTAQAKLVTRNVNYEQDGVQLQGYLAYDDTGPAKRPGILVVHEWWGLNDYARHRVDQLAKMGYVAFGLDMYGQGKSTTHPKEAGEWMNQVDRNIDFWRQRALAGLEVLRNDPHTDTSKMAAIGYCFGGSTVQQLAYSGAGIEGVVSFHGGLQTPPADADNVVRAKILICHGADDPFTKPEDLQKYLAAMKGTHLDWQMIIYGGARHSFTNPDADKAGMTQLKYNARADRRSWAQMKLFFDELFGK